jgi:hypothetical protein
MGANSEMNGSAAPASRGDGPGCEPVDELVVERNGGRVTAKWNIAGFAAQNKASKVIYSKYFEVGGYDCRLLVYPSGASLPIATLPSLIASSFKSILPYILLCLT